MDEESEIKYFWVCTLSSLAVMCLRSIMAPIIANSEYGQEHRNKYLDPSRKHIHAHYESSNSYGYFQEYVKCQGQTVPTKYLNTRNNYLTYENYSAHPSKVINKVKILKSRPNFKVNVTGKKCWYRRKGFVTRNT